MSCSYKTVKDLQDSDIQAQKNPVNLINPV